jgi:hypothetical protein
VPTRTGLTLVLVLSPRAFSFGQTANPDPMLEKAAGSLATVLAGRSMKAALESNASFPSLKLRVVENLKAADAATPAASG